MMFPTLDYMKLCTSISTQFNLYTQSNVRTYYMWIMNPNLVFRSPKLFTEVIFPSRFTGTLTINVPLMIILNTNVESRSTQITPIFLQFSPDPEQN
jgi:hypothetical protein